MSTALFSLPYVLAPLHGLLRKLTHAKPCDRTLPCNSLAGTQHEVVFSAACSLPVATPTAQQGANSMSMRPLRVVHILDAGLSPTQVGRMKISGRMADVCAELDRLAACEATLH